MASTNWGGVRKGAGPKPYYDEPCGREVYYLPKRLIGKLSKLAKGEKITASRKLAQILERVK